MKKCPACNHEYDDALRFCLEDGTTLVRTGELNHATMTMPAAPEFRPPPPPTLVMRTAPSMSIGRTFVNIFVAPARAFTSFRDVAYFGPAVARFLLAAGIIVFVLMVYAAVYQAYFGLAEITRAAVDATPRISELQLDAKRRTVEMANNPTFRIVSLVTTFGGIAVYALASMPLGALIYWLGGLAFRAPLTYMKALLVWTFATLPPRVVWAIVNILTLFVWPPTSDLRIATGGAGVFPSNPAWLVPSTTLPLPTWVVALTAFDLFEFYGLALAVVGLRKAGRLPWWGSLVVVAPVWVAGIAWRIGSAGLINLLYK